MIRKAHHKQQDLCYKRPDYREPRFERAVKVYTINQESKYLIIQGVPAVGASKELVQRCALYGDVEEYRLLDEYPTDEFTEVYWVKFVRIQSARHAKRKLDSRPFFGGTLHVFYAPEYETVQETREKLQQRRQHIARRCSEKTTLDIKKPTAEEDKPNTAFLHPRVLLNPVSDIIGQQGSCSVPSKNHVSDKTLKTSDSSVACVSAASIVTNSSSQSSTVNKRPCTDQCKIKTKNASLPAEIQGISVKEAYNLQTTHTNTSRKEDSDLSQPALATEKHGMSGASTCKRINWYSKATLICAKNETEACTPLVPGALPKYGAQPGAELWERQSSEPDSEPGAFDPHKLKRKAEQSLTGDDALDTTLFKIRAKLKESIPSSKSSSGIDSMKRTTSHDTKMRKRKNDGRIRI